MFKDNDRISTREAAFFITASLIEVGTLTGARTLAREVGPDLWLAFILGYLFTLPAIFVTVKLGQRFYRHGFVEYSRIIAGPVIGWILSAALVVYWFFVSARVLRTTADVVRLTLLDKTPFEVIAFSFMLLAVYICWYGIEPLCRISLLTTIVIVPSIVIAQLAAINRFKIDNLLPFMAEGPLPVLKLGLKEIGDFEEMTFFLFLIPFMNKPEKAMKAAFYGSMATVPLFLFSIVLPIGVLGTELAKHQLYPLITVLEAVEFPGAFIERLGIVFTGLWIIIAFPTVCGLLYAMALVLSRMFGLKDHRPFIIPLVPLIYMISAIPENAAQSEEFFKFLTPYGIVVLLFIPLLLYIIALIRGVKDG